jgi:CRP/FNR family transcriptional regulator, anaerobic regulatory protein
VTTVTANTVLCAACPLRQAPGFGSPDAAIRWFHSGVGTERRSAEVGAELSRAGDNFGSAGALFTGWALRYKLLADGRRQILSILLPGDLFGIDAILVGKPDHSVQAVTAVTYGIMHDDRLKQLIATAPNFSAALLQRSLVERRRADRHATLIGRCSAEERIAGFLVETHARLRQRRLGGPSTFNMPLTQQQLGDHLGLTVVHVNRVLRRLRETAVMTARGHMVVIHDMPALRRRAQLDDDGSGGAPEEVVSPAI